jgi:REP element-mobilizing transposase RayT
MVRAVERSFRASCERDAFRLVHYSLQRDHVHLLVEAEGPAALASGMKSIAARLARAVHRASRRRGPVFSDRFHHRVLATPREVRNALAYVLLNARKHAGATLRRQLDAVAAIDPASSGRWFSGWARSPSPSEFAHSAPVPCERALVACARTWLLRVGWIRHGPIDPREVPGRRR